MKAEIFSYSRARGAFAEISQEGSPLRPYNDANKELYGKPVDALQIIRDGAVTAPPAAADLMAALRKKAPKRVL